MCGGTVNYKYYNKQNSSQHWEQTVITQEIEEILRVTKCNNTWVWVRECMSVRRRNVNKYGDKQNSSHH